MPSTVVALLEAAGLEHGGVVAWGEPVPCDRPGIYLVALTSDPNSTDGSVSPEPISLVAVEELTEGLKADPVRDRQPWPDKELRRTSSACGWIAHRRRGSTAEKDLQRVRS